MGIFAKIFVMSSQPKISAEYLAGQATIEPNEPAAKIGLRLYDGVEPTTASLDPDHEDHLGGDANELAAISEIRGSAEEQERSATGVVEPGHLSARRPERRRYSEITIESIDIGSIYGEHPLAIAIRNNFGLQFPQIPADEITEGGLMDLAYHFLLHVVSVKGQILCVAGLRYFRVLHNKLPPKTRVPVLLHTRLSAGALRNLILWDLFVMPIIAGLNSPGRKSAAIAWSNEQMRDLLSHSFQRDPLCALTELLDCDRRTIQGWLAK